ncbi:Cell division protein FtsI/penicillin-binding protein 2 [Salinibacillus kushneri]|uniref:serine-type D-Ala-D-Ala carboxypeptidase n=1 Tax=Salinibacillus kushneri TaxID=237682 RepID=A0A1I0ASU4_9BACI|nr:penicillin-binding protein 2 [Salinibacillus kushneri]SES97447.1 Cell division protein FtsI/penicillin-binding protein 2 [Salinibacillus kushneri]
MKRKSQLPFRLNILFFAIFVIFSFLVLQLGVVQILTGGEAQQVLDETENTITNIPVPRGKMYDRDGNLIVDNKSTYAITYTPPKNVQPKDKLDIAQKLSNYIQVDNSDITQRDMKDYWILTRREEAYARLSESEKKRMNDEEQYQSVLDRLTKYNLDHLSKEELQVVAIKRKLDEAMELTPHIVKNKGVTQEEYATVAEHSNEMQGINVTTDWDRKLPQGETFANFIGGITDHEDGILKDNVDYYLTRNYNRNERVGQSFLEQQYEEVLAGQKEQYRHITDKNNNVIRSELIQEGKQGKDLVLSVDMELQKKVDQIVQEELEKIIDKYPYKNQYLNNALVVMMKPKTGEILSMTGIRYHRPENEANYFADESYRTVYDAHLPGSAIKGATVLSGFQSGVITKNTVFNDRPIKIANTETKSSYGTLGPVNYLTALEKSSNVFMFFVAMRMGGDYTYVENQSVDFNPEAFTEMRNYFKQFGLGVETGIDLPYEATGLEGDKESAGLLMDYAIGQYEPFTTLQLAQYVSTIANDGYRIKPHLVNEIRYPGTKDQPGRIYKTIGPEVINKLEMDEEYIQAVQNGFYRVFNGSNGTAAGTFSNLPYVAAGKTGTAEQPIYENGKLIADTENLTLVGYAPYDDPEVSFAVVVPRVGLESGDTINYKIGKRILDAYFENQQNN